MVGLIQALHRQELVDLVDQVVAELIHLMQVELQLTIQDQHNKVILVELEQEQMLELVEAVVALVV
jgi:hypothetical protein